MYGGERSPAGSQQPSPFDAHLTPDPLPPSSHPYIPPSLHPSLSYDITDSAGEAPSLLHDLHPTEDQPTMRLYLPCLSEYMTTNALASNQYICA